MSDAVNAKGKVLSRLAQIVGTTALIALVPGLASALPITNLGTAILDAGNGDVVVSGNGMSGGCINWYNGCMPPATCPTAGGGTFTVEAGFHIPTHCPCGQ